MKKTVSLMVKKTQKKKGFQSEVFFFCGLGLGSGSFCGGYLGFWLVFLHFWFFFCGLWEGSSKGQFKLLGRLSQNFKVVPFFFDFWFSLGGV